jgi:phenylpyruvate tautomerase PptA (4-oxalocrotonate tautomerase family)
MRLLPHQRAAPHRVTTATYIAFDELADENWSIAGKLLDEE